jgi:hypothetical protein
LKKTIREKRELNVFCKNDEEAEREIATVVSLLRKGERTSHPEKRSDVRI